jgi:hypothetical protein
MNGLIIEFEIDVVNKIRSAKNTAEVVSIVDTSFKTVQSNTSGNLSISTFANEMQLALSSINPFVVSDAVEYNLIQEARVRYHRLTTKLNLG